MAQLTDSQWRAIAAVLADGQTHSDEQLARVAKAKLEDVRTWVLAQERQLQQQVDGPLLMVSHQVIEFGQPAALRVQYMTRTEYQSYCERLRAAREQSRREREQWRASPEGQQYERECEAAAAKRNRR